MRGLFRLVFFPRKHGARTACSLVCHNRSVIEFAFLVSTNSGERSIVGNIRDTNYLRFKSRKFSDVKKKVVKN